MAMVWSNYEKNKVFGLFPPGGYKRLNCRELNCRWAQQSGAQLSVGSTGRAQLSQAQLSVNHFSHVKA